jgi:hypothetical protein
MFSADCHDFSQVVEREIHRRMGSHIEAFDAEIYRVGACLDCCVQ